MFKVRIEGEVVEIDRRFADVSALIQLHYNPNDNDDDLFSFSENVITKEIFEIIRQYYENNNFQPEQVEINTSIARELFKNEMDRELILQYDPINSDIVKKLYDASVYLQLEALRQLCLARIYYAFTFDPSDENAFTKLNTKFPNLGPIQIKDIEAYENHLAKQN